MNEKNDKSLQENLKKVAQLPFVQGPVLGAGLMLAVTPGLNWTNHVQQGMPMVWSKCMTGAFAYASSAVPSFAMSFAIKAALTSKTEKPSVAKDFTTSFAAGALSGLASTPFEAVAQNQQMVDKTLPKAEQRKQVANTRAMMIAKNGYSSLGQGAVAIMLREGKWTLVYFSAAPVMINYCMTTHKMPEKQAKVVGLLATAGVYGFFSTPLTQLRARKQSGLTVTRPNKSYLEHVRDIWNQEPKASTSARVRTLFKGVIPRTVTTTAGGALMVAGTNVYNSVTKSSSS